MKVIRAAMQIFLVAGLLTATTYAIPMIRKSPYKGVYEAIRLGTSDVQAQKVLQIEGVSCESVPQEANASRICAFTDLWRHYEIVLAPSEQKVVRKSFSYKPPIYVFKSLFVFGGR